MIDVLAPGLATSVQAGPRHGLRHLGVAAAGALDPWSQALANLLVGNPPDSAALEMTLTGPTLRFARCARVAWCGADVEAEVDGVPVPGARRVDVPAGSTLRFGRARAGARTYLAVAGGIAVEPVLGSRSTDLRGGFGGGVGRLLRAGDRLPYRLGSTGVVDDIRALQVARWWVDTLPDDRVADAVTQVRVLPGRDRCLPADGLFDRVWAVAAASNRQGLRLTGAALALADDVAERVSEPVLPGTIQLPADGQPIVLLADAQTHGGYARVAHAIRADWPWLAQLRPGDQLRFEPCTMQDAATAASRQRQRLYRLGLAIAARSSQRA